MLRLFDPTLPQLLLLRSPDIVLSVHYFHSSGFPLFSLLNADPLFPPSLDHLFLHFVL